MIVLLLVYNVVGMGEGIAMSETELHKRHSTVFGVLGALGLLIRHHSHIANPRVWTLHCN